MTFNPVCDPLRQRFLPTSMRPQQRRTLIFAFFFPAIMAASLGCRNVVDRPDEATQQSQSNDELEEAAQYVDDNGNIDWRRRVDDVAKSIDQATSSRRWGRETAAINAALKAARLMPPKSKDFDLAQEMAKTESELDNVGANEPSDSNHKSGGDVPDASDSVSNAEVAKLRQALQDVFAALESDGIGSERGKSGNAPNYVTDAIEIR